MIQYFLLRVQVHMIEINPQIKKLQTSVFKDLSEIEVLVYFSLLTILTEYLQQCVENQDSVCIPIEIKTVEIGEEDIIYIENVVLIKTGEQIYVIDFLESLNNKKYINTMYIEGEYFNELYVQILNKDFVAHIIPGKEQISFRIKKT